MVRHLINILDKNPWNALFGKGIPEDLAHPYELFDSFVHLLKKNKAKRVLDVACGTGRHTLALAQHMFDVSAFDISNNSIKLTKEKLKKAGLQANVIRADMFKKYPFEDNSFDGVFAIQAIYHGTEQNFEFALSEIARVVKSESPVFITVTYNKERSTLGAAEAQFVEVNADTYIPVSGREKGLIHFYPDSEKLEMLLKKHFSNVRIEEDTKRKYYVATCYL